MGLNQNLPKVLSKNIPFFRKTFLFYVLGNKTYGYELDLIKLEVI
jgi:hypothetical protein